MRSLTFLAILQAGHLAIAAPVLSPTSVIQFDITKALQADIYHRLEARHADDSNSVETCLRLALPDPESHRAAHTPSIVEIIPCPSMKHHGVDGSLAHGSQHGDGTSEENACSSRTASMPAHISSSVNATHGTSQNAHATSVHDGASSGRGIHDSAVSTGKGSNSPHSSTINNDIGDNAGQAGANGTDNHPGNTDTGISNHPDNNGTGNGNGTSSGGINTKANSNTGGDHDNNTDQNPTDDTGFNSGSRHIAHPNKAADKGDTNGDTPPIIVVTAGTGVDPKSGLPATGSRTIASVGGSGNTPESDRCSNGTSAEIVACLGVRVNLAGEGTMTSTTATYTQSSSSPTSTAIDCTLPANVDLAVCVRGVVRL